MFYFLCTLSSTTVVFNLPDTVNIKITPNIMAKVNVLNKMNSDIMRIKECEEKL